MGKHSTINLESAKRVLWHFGDQNIGIEPSGFDKALILTITRADRDNLDKLYAAFPDFVELVTDVKRWGFESFRDRVIRADAAKARNAEIFDLDLLLVVGL